VEAPGKNSLRLPFGSLFLLFRDPVIEKNWPQQGKRIWSFGFGDGQRCFLIKDRYKRLFEAVSQKIPAGFSSQKLLDRNSHIATIRSSTLYPSQNAVSASPNVFAW
jgi:hypothetical protein